MAQSGGSLPTQTKEEDKVMKLRALLSRMNTFVDHFEALIQKVLHELQDYRHQAKGYIQSLGTFSETQSLRLRTPQGPDCLCEDVKATRPSAWQQNASREDGAAPHLPPTGPKPPQFWQDALIQQVAHTSLGQDQHWPGALKPEEPALDPIRKDYPYLNPIYWHASDFEDTWERRVCLPWQSKRRVVPQSVERVRVLHHGGLVRTVALSSFTRHLFTCGGGVKVWNLASHQGNMFPVAHLRAQTPGGSLHSCLLSPDNSLLLVGGDSLAGVSLWDLKASCLHECAQMPCIGLSSQALGVCTERCLVLASFSQGSVRAWDPRTQQVVRDLRGPPDSAMRLAVKGQTVWTGGLDSCLRCWDLRAPSKPQEFDFESEIMGLCPHPLENLVLVSTANGQQWLQSTENLERRSVAFKDVLIVDLKFSPQGQWWVSVGMDDLVTMHGMPEGTRVLQVPELASITCCDVSENNRLLATGSQQQATVYQLRY